MIWRRGCGWYVRAMLVDLREEERWRRGNTKATETESKRNTRATKAEKKTVARIAGRRGASWFFKKGNYDVRFEGGV